ncbi:MAG: GNAT family N-acetyltransferase [bacterium]
MNNKLVFKKLTDFQPGILFDLLTKSYDQFITSSGLTNPQKFISKWRRFDENAFNNLRIGKCVLVSCLGDKVIGFASYDPRRLPEFGVVGQNVILPEYRRMGYGKAQIEEIIRIFKSKKCRKVIVSTGEIDFFKPAQSMYLNLGFKESRKFKREDIEFGEIEYELKLENNSPSN